MRTALPSRNTLTSALTAALVLVMCGTFLLGQAEITRWVTLPVLALLLAINLHPLLSPQIDLPVIGLGLCGFYIATIPLTSFLGHPHLNMALVLKATIALGLMTAPWLGGLACYLDHKRLMILAFRLMSYLFICAIIISYIFGWGEIIDMRDGVRRAYASGGDGYTMALVFLILFAAAELAYVRLALLFTLLFLMGAKLGLGLSIIGLTGLTPLIIRHNKKGALFLILSLLLGSSAGIAITYNQLYFKHPQTPTADAFTQQPAQSLKTVASSLPVPQNIQEVLQTGDLPHSGLGTTANYWLMGSLSTGIGRLICFGAGYQMFLDSPIYGVGYDQSATPDILNTAARQDPFHLQKLIGFPDSRFAAEADISNQFFQVAAELGIIGLIGFVLFSGFIVFFAVRCYKLALKHHASALVLSSIVWLILLVLGNQTSTWLQPGGHPTTILLFIALGQLSLFYRQYSCARTYQISIPQGLMLANIASAVLGLIQGLFVAYTLGPGQYGIIGVLLTLGGVVANFWDVRLTDLATKLHYQFKDDRAAQSASVRLTLLLNTALAILMALCTALAGFLLWQFFIDEKPALFWLVAQGALIGGSFLLGCLQYMKRLTGNFLSFGLIRLSAQIVLTATLILSMYLHPTIDGYYDGMLVALSINLPITCLALTYFWKRSFKTSLLAGALRTAWPYYASEKKFIFSSNIFSYSKMLSRSGDILVFSYFASDHATGIYRLARSLTDNLSIFNDALVQYYQPKFLKLLAHHENGQMMAYARRFMLIAAIFIPAAAVIFAILFHYINEFALRGQYAGLPLTSGLLILNYFWIAGIHTWLWPYMLHHKQAHRIAYISLAAGCAQISFIALCCIVAKPDPIHAAAGSTIYYLALYPILLYWWKGHQPINKATTA